MSVIKNSTLEYRLTNRIASTDSSPIPMIFRMTSEGRLEMGEMLKSKEDDIGIPERQGLKEKVKGRIQAIECSKF